MSAAESVTVRGLVLRAEAGSTGCTTPRVLDNTTPPRGVDSGLSSTVGEPELVGDLQPSKQKSPAVVREDALQPIQFLLQC